MASGDPYSARISIRWAVAQALSDSPDGLQDLASTPAIRRITTAYLASINTLRWDWNEQDDVELVRAWVDAVEKANVKEDTLFEPLALAVYQRGFYELTERLLAKAPEDGILSVWLKSKLLFRKGNIEEATALLAKVAISFPIHDDSGADKNVDRTSSHQPSTEKHLIYRTELKESSYRPNGEWGILLLHRGEYIQSMDVLLRAGYWMDAAYIAERVLNIDELKTYVDQNWPAKQESMEEGDFNPEYPPSAWNRWASDEAKHFQIRYLLARRLAREDRAEDASPYYPVYWRKRFEQRIQQLQIGYDETQPKGVRAEALWQAAKTTRYMGLELIGTELGPDWAIHQGNYEVGVTIDERQNQNNTVLTPRPSEIERATQTRLKPYERWHYRLLATDIAWDALQLMPDNDVTTAHRYCEAGAWIKNQKPKAADRFYKALVRRCRETDIGKAADSLRWFPTLDADGKLQKKEKPLEEVPKKQSSVQLL